MTSRRATPAYVEKTITLFAVGVTIGLTAVAFWLSYEHLHDVAADNGLAGVRAWAWPATLDAFIVIGETLILRASLLRIVDRWAIFLTIVGSLGSIVLNVTGVGQGAGTLDYTVAAVPPVAALLAFGILMRQLHQALSRRMYGHEDQPPVPAPVLSLVPGGKRDNASIDFLRGGQAVPLPRDRDAEVVFPASGPGSRPVPASGPVPSRPQVPGSVPVSGPVPSRSQVPASDLGSRPGQDRLSGWSVCDQVRSVLSRNPDASNMDVRISVIEKFGPDTKPDTIRKAIRRVRAELPPY